MPRHAGLPPHKQDSGQDHSHHAMAAVTHRDNDPEHGSAAAGRDPDHRRDDGCLVQVLSKDQGVSGNTDQRRPWIGASHKSAPDVALNDRQNGWQNGPRIDSRNNDRERDSWRSDDRGHGDHDSNRQPTRGGRP